MKNEEEMGGGGRKGWIVGKDEEEGKDGEGKEGEKSFTLLTAVIIVLQPHHHLQGSEEAFTGVKLDQLCEYVLERVAQLADCHGDDVIQDAGQVLLKVQSAIVLQSRLLNNAHH